ncbi:unnamed protein product [Prorocentrum cordatum]|uniref:Prolyl 4-hydroxylase alpha subunit Fe(2+) 2OG dioxygenase domain-containing protein n=1 Tax=Prorocentrum cordatum TaxID=2364126 RepID=A0ABN9XUA8_9DINO|nr:unnamed protein product [Polarella glacialis]
MYEKFFGKCPTLGFLSGSAAEAEGLLGLAFGFAFLSGVAAALNRHRPAGAPAVEPSPRMQLACYDGGGARYGEHTDCEERGGALRMHGATPGAEVDVMPEGGTLVLPTSHRRMALTMWLLDPKA